MFLKPLLDDKSIRNADFGCGAESAARSEWSSFFANVKISYQSTSSCKK